MKWLRTSAVCLVVICSSVFLSLLASQTEAKTPIRNSFFNVYPSALSSRLDDLASNPGHCGVCHFDFEGGGPKNPYGLAVDVARNSGSYSTDEDAIVGIEGEDSDNDGFSNLIEITDTINFINTPTFPGLNQNNISSVVNVSTIEIDGHLVPSGGEDATPPTVTVVSPNGGESFDGKTVGNITWSAADASGISHVDIYLSDDNGLTYMPIAEGRPNDQPFDWFVHNLPGSQNLVRVVARDNAGNYGFDDSDNPFTIVGYPFGRVPTTLRDMQLSGTQPFEGGILEDPDVSCTTCHGNYDTAVEPWHNWKGSTMGQAARDPVFLACLVTAEQAAPSVGDQCLRCHTPGGWQEGRAVDPMGNLLTAKDRQGVQCDFCHRAVDPDFELGVSPLEDIAVLDALDVVPLDYANGQFVTDPNPFRRGPYFDADSNHGFLQSPFHLKSEMCGTCHDVSNPVYVRGSTPHEYVPNSFDTPHPDEDQSNMFPLERTYSEWSMSEYAAIGVHAPQFAGSKPDGIVSTCQDCHMADVSGRGSSEPSSPVRSDLALHDFSGGNHFLADILPSFYPGEVDSLRLLDGKLRVIDMLQKAASMSLSTGEAPPDLTLTVAIVNETGHKLPTGYPEGRRMWINVKAFDDASALVYESGAYDEASALLAEDPALKVYQIKPGISRRIAPVVSVPFGPSFNFVLNDTIFSDNRIPPRGFTNANFEAIQSQPIAYAYADGQFSDTTTYLLPATTVFAEVTLYFQTITREYVEWLRDHNATNSMGQDLFDAWTREGKAAPVAVVTDTVSMPVPVDVPVGEAPRFRNALLQNSPNPFNPLTKMGYSLKAAGRVSIRVYDVSGTLVRTLVDAVRPAGMYEVIWDGRNDAGNVLSSGVYVVKMNVGDYGETRKAVLLK
jgi:hypothetical protein